MITKLYFDIIFNPKVISDIGKVMEKMDLGIFRIWLPTAERISFVTTTRVDYAYIKKALKTIRKAYVSEGNEVIDVVFISKEEKE